MLIFCIIPLITNNMTAFTWIALFIWLSLFLFATIKHLVEQKEKPKVDPLPMQKRTVNATISWESHKNKGLLYPKFQVMNGEIFPVCFIDENGVPISLMLCVVMEHFHWTDSHHCVCTIQLVLDDAPEDKLLQKGNRFYPVSYTHLVYPSKYWGTFCRNQIFPYGININSSPLLL